VHFHKPSLYKDAKPIVRICYIVVEIDNLLQQNKQVVTGLQSHFAHNPATRASWCLPNHCLALVNVEKWLVSAGALKMYD